MIALFFIIESCHKLLINKRIEENYYNYDRAHRTIINAIDNICNSLKRTQDIVDINSASIKEISILIEKLMNEDIDGE